MTKNRIDTTLAQYKKTGKKALIPFITSGDGGYDCTEQAVMEMIKNGADLIELGVPFSDPIAEGPVIQRASERSLRQGTTLSGIFEMVQRLRKKTDTPLLFMMYLNTIFRFGTDRFFQTCQICGIDGVIVPDIPYEEKDEIQGSADKYNVHNISLVTPASEDRIQMIASDATGFLYCVSSNGVTGVRQKFDTEFDPLFEKIYKYAKIPCAVGFGISGPEAAKKMSKYCDGVIIGSAIVKLVEQYGGKTAPKEIGIFIKSLRQALDN
ncbi:MAG: tryptophan synthase subunit alpha [Ruminococcus sp.]|nr:tryptophan synthase subunit alpha [Ruminococcus sp.]